MTEVVIPQEIEDQMDVSALLIYCLQCDIVLYKHEEENIVSRHVANEAMMGHARDLGHNVVKLGKADKLN